MGLGSLPAGAGPGSALGHGKVCVQPVGTRQENLVGRALLSAQEDGGFRWALFRSASHQQGQTAQTHPAPENNRGRCVEAHTQVTSACNHCLREARAQALGDVRGTQKPNPVVERAKTGTRTASTWQPAWEEQGSPGAQVLALAGP